MKPIELFGRGSINELGKILKKWNCFKVLLITGKKSFDTAPRRKVIESNLAGFMVLRHHDFEINPNIYDLVRGAQIVNEFNPDVIVGIGGGSVLDTAKLLSVLPSSESEVRSITIGEAHVPDRKKHLVLAPTTSGSGSEATHFAVAYVGMQKYSISSPEMVPDLVILDSEFTDTMSGKLTAITAFDALSQAIESFWAVGATKESLKYASDSIAIIMDVFKDIINNPSSSDRDKMMKASFQAGKAINISKTTGPHAVSYALTKKFGIAHGLAVILTLPAFLEYNTNISSGTLNKGIDIDEFRTRIAELYRLMKVDNAEGAINRIHKMIEQAGFKVGLCNYGINDNDDLLWLSGSVNIERLNNNPSIIDFDSLKLILKKSHSQLLTKI